jgi:hypothetical protein
VNSLSSLRAHAAQKSLQELGAQRCVAAEIAAVRSSRGEVL